MTSSSEEEAGKSLETVARSAVRLVDRLVDQADLTALTLTDELVENALVRQALLSGTFFRMCTFRKCNFSRADFEGAVFESCTFEECDFSVADFRSLEAAHTRFIGCIFDEGSTRSCRYVDCEFERCRIELHSFEENRIEGTKFVACSFRRSTLIHCDFDDVLFDGTDLADCTAQFHLFRECTFDRSQLNAEAIGLTFGLTRENLKAVGLVWRGIGIEKHESEFDLAQDLVTTYEARGWKFAAAVLKLNFSLLRPYEALGEIFNVLEQNARSPRPVNADEVWFLSRIVERLSTDGRMPFISIARGLDAAVACAELREYRDAAAFKPLYHTLKDAEYSELLTIERGLAPIAECGTNERLQAKFVFSDEPPLSFRSWLVALQQEGLLAGPLPQFVRASTGSYFEVFYIPVATLSSILICLSLVERIVEKLTYIRVRARVLFSSTPPAPIRKRALQPIAAASPALLKELSGLITQASRSTDFVSDVQQFSGRLRQVEIAPREDGLSS